MFQVCTDTVAVTNWVKVGKMLTKVESRFEAPARIEGHVNDLLGITSRSILVDTGRKAANGDPLAQEALAQVIVTLTVLDVGGGPVSFIVDTLGNKMLTDRAFHNSKRAFEKIGKEMADYITELGKMYK